ncbi:RHS repeat domain-containing protein [Pseudomonas sp. DSP3-2-2]|uniref:RHS repeat domain-containing protein n=1 Tax=unclassified Pseudomonas TaxID=196821 RepID=UPI003CE8B260
MKHIYSNAYNFLSFVTAGVDPRTGTYSCNISLSALMANALSGPSVPVSIGFNALNTANAGFGLGWTLPLTRYNSTSRELVLSSGARYRANLAPDLFVLIDKKVRDLKATRVGDELFVEHKSGIVEVLTTSGSSGDEWLVSKIYSPEGRAVSLVYSLVGGQQLLREIRDESSTLLTVDVPTGSSLASSITLWPESPSRKLVFMLQMQNNELTKISVLLDNNSRASWRLTYGTVDGLRLITRLELPTGGIDRIEYQASALSLPADAPVSALPAVSSHTSFAGSDQPPVRREYRYSLKNYLGNGSNARWRDDGDNLYQAPGDYEYESTEELVLGAGTSKRTVRSTRRIYNRFHLPVEETVNQNGKTVRSRTQYHEKPGLKFEEQPANFQLPMKVETSYFDTTAPDVVRIETTLTEYDEFGNILKTVSPTGITEVFTYYPLGETDGCPADSFGAVRWLKRKTLIPAPDRAPAAALTCLYRYIQLPSASSQRDAFLALEKESVFQDDEDAPVMAIARQYEADRDSIFFGRVTRKIETVQGIESVFDYHYERMDDAVCTKTTLTAADGASTTRSTWQNLFTGNEEKTVGQLGVASEVTHDRLGRKTLEMLAPKTSSQATRTHSYHLADRVDDPVETRTVAANGGTMLTRLDGMSRRSTVEVQDVDADGQPMRAVYSASYDALGQMIEETNTDWLDGKPHALSSRYTYDDWGNRSAHIGPDGVLNHDRHDPIALTQTQGSDKAGLTIITKNAFGKNDTVERIDRNGKSCAITSYRYDGLGRCVQQTDPLGNVTRFEYDFADRLVLTQLPDGSRIKKAFVAHSTEDLATHIWVNDYLVGQRTYDGLLRVTDITVGGRTERFTYTGSQPNPATHATAGSKVIAYKYDPALNNQVIERSVEGSSNLSAQFRYDNLQARLIQASSPDNQQQRNYSPSGQLASDNLSAGQTSLDSAQRSSLNGLPMVYVDASGLKQIIRYDALCRIAQVEQGTVKADYAYDQHGHVSRIETLDTQSERKLITELEYDDFGREVRRVLTVDPNQPEELSQQFNESDKLIRRTLRRGSSLMRDEVFAYDVRGRLERYQCDGEHLPVDSCGKAILRQTYTFDELDNIRQLKTEFAEGENVATYEYESPDKTQLSRVRHSHTDYAAQEAIFTYDPDGNQLNDELGRRMIYDDLGRLASVAQEQA